MKKSLLKISGARNINKNSQKSLNGGFKIGGCFSGCYSQYLACPPHGCIVLGFNGEQCSGTLQGSGQFLQCCV